MVCSCSIFTVLAAILHLGNVTFRKVQVNIFDCGFEIYDLYNDIPYRRIMKMQLLLLILTQ